MFKKPNRRVHTVFLHHSATDSFRNDNVEFIRKVHVDENGWSDIGYHYYINSSGKVFPCRPLERKPAAQGGFNSGTIAICLGGKDKFTAAQRRSLTKLCSQINDAYRGDIAFKGHKEVKPTECPNYDYKEWLNLDKSGLMKIKPLTQSRTIGGAGLAGTSVLAGEVVSSTAEKLEPLTGYSEMIQVLFVVLALIGVGLAVYARIDDHKKGRK